MMYPLVFSGDDSISPHSSSVQDSDPDSEDHSKWKEKPGTFDESKPKSKPKFVKPDDMHRVVLKPAGNLIKLKCLAEGNPIPNITWTKNEEPPERHLGAIKYNRWSIRLEDLITEDSGNYTCNVCNSLGCIAFTFKVEITGKSSKQSSSKFVHCCLKYGKARVDCPKALFSTSKQFTTYIITSYIIMGKLLWLSK